MCFRESDASRLRRLDMMRRGPGFTAREAEQAASPKWLVRYGLSNEATEEQALVGWAQWPTEPTELWGTGDAGPAFAGDLGHLRVSLDCTRDDTGFRVWCGEQRFEHRSGPIAQRQVRLPREHTLLYGLARFVYAVCFSAKLRDRLGLAADITPEAVAGAWRFDGEPLPAEVASRITSAVRQRLMETHG